MLVGRDVESAAISSFLESLTCGPGVLLVEGEAGIGKTVLLSQARETAARMGHRILSTAPDETELFLAFSGLTDLLECVPAGMVTRLPRPQRAAISELALQASHRRGSPQLRAAATAVLTLLRQLSRKAPVVILVDDLQWLDSTSASVLRFVLRRLRVEPVGVLAAVRTDWSGNPPPLATDDVPAELVDHLRLGPLGLSTIRELLTLRRAARSLSGSGLTWLYETCGGNPLFAMELAEKAEINVLPRPYERSRVPDSLNRAVYALTGLLSRGSRDVLLISSLSTEPTLAVICAAARDPATAFTDLEAGIDAGMVATADGKVVFVHPLLRFAVAAQATAGDRCAAHRRLAAVVTDPGARAWHRALGSDGPDETVAADLEIVARAAVGSGARPGSSELAGLSVTLTPLAQAESRRRRATFAAERYFEMSDPARACSMLESAIDAMPRGPARAGLRQRLAGYRAFSGEPAEARLTLLDHALTEAGDDAGLRAEILTEKVVCASFTGHTDPLDLEIIERLADRGTDPALRARCCAGLAFSAFARGDGLKADMVTRALGGPLQQHRLSIELRPNVAIGHVLHWTDDLDGARALYDQDYDRVVAQGAKAELPFVLWALVETEGWAGNWERAERLGAEGYHLAENSGSPLAIGFMSVARGLLHAYRGRVDASLRDATRAIDIAGQLGMPLLAIMAAQCFGITALPAGDVMALHRRLAPFREMVSIVTRAEPALCRFLPDEIEALTRVGELDMAEDLLGPFTRRSSELGRGWGQAAASRCRGLLLAAQGDLDGAAASLDTTLEMDQRLSMPFETARTLLTAGEIHRRARHKRKALDFLQEAQAIFERLGAPLWEDQARNEIARIGIRATAGGQPERGLTAAERRVADLAVMGRTNVEIAAELFMGRRTVEAHLSRIYQKLGVRSRTELCQLLLSSPDLR
jgi:DNA-binding CsgD family transcriptional regulator